MPSNAIREAFCECFLHFQLSGVLLHVCSPQKHTFVVQALNFTKCMQALARLCSVFCRIDSDPATVYKLAQVVKLQFNPASCAFPATTKTHNRASLRVHEGAQPPASLEKACRDYLSLFQNACRKDIKLDLSWTPLPLQPGQGQRIILRNGPRTSPVSTTTILELWKGKRGSTTI